MVLVVPTRETTALTAVALLALTCGRAGDAPSGGALASSEPLKAAGQVALTVGGKAMPPPLELEGFARACGSAPPCTPRLGDATVRFKVSDGPELFEWVDHLFKGKLVDTSYTLTVPKGQATVEATDSLITRVGFEPAASGSLTLRIDWHGQTLLHQGLVGHAHVTQATSPPGKTSVSMPSLKGVVALGAELPTLTALITEEKGGTPPRLPSRHYAGWELDCLKVEIGSAGYAAAEALARAVIADGTIEDSEYQATEVVSTDAAGAVTSRVIYEAAPVKATLDPAKATATVALLVRRFTIVGSSTAKFGPFPVDVKRGCP